MITLLEAGARLQRTLDARQWRFCFISGVANFRWGTPRLTTDLVVHKAFAARPQDWADIKGVILRQRGRLDWRQIWTELQDLAALKEAPELLDELAQVAQRAESVIGPYQWRP